MKNELKTKIIYQVYVRNFSKEGTFKAVTKKLDYLKDELKVDIVYLLPINTIGSYGKKGDLGCPYSIKNYYEINSELGTLEDFKELINETHSKNMKLMIDIVFNHTSRDSEIVKNHPEWMYKNNERKMANKVGDWSDVYDLDYSNPELIDYLVDVIKYYSDLGVDGYRFDVASLIPSSFYIKLKEMLNKHHPDTILLAESIHPNFATYTRSLGFNALSDAELYELGFDLLYPYNNFEYLKDYLIKKDSSYLDIYKVLLEYEEAYNPSSNLRIRGLENHDQPRLIEYTKNERLLHTLLALPVFMKGPMFIYNGLETKADHNLSLFTKDLMDDTIDEKWFNYVKKVINFKKEEFNLDVLTSSILPSKGNNIVIRNNFKDGTKMYGLFNLSSSLTSSIIKSEELEDGAYIDYLTNKVYVIENKSIRVKEPLYLFKAETIKKTEN